MRIWIRRVLLATFVAALCTVGLFVVEIVLAINQRTKEPPFVNPNHLPVNLGKSGPAVTYVVLGDSTSAGRGADYQDGIAMGTARHLALIHRVKMVNLSVSGAKSLDVLTHQIPEASRLMPNLVLLSVGANDTTHFTPSDAVRSHLDDIIDALRLARPDVKIVVTGCPQMGSVPRFMQPLRWFAGTQTARINRVFTDVVARKKVVWARIADRTGPTFTRDPSLFAADEFHPNKRGYVLWINVLNEALDKSLGER